MVLCRGKQGSEGRWEMGTRTADVWLQQDKYMGMKAIK
jgi:hypothetical protein